MSKKPTVREVNPLTAPRARRFNLVRDDDETGISGTGVVAEGIEFSNGMCAMCWLTAMHSVAVYPNVRQLEAIHGHNGRTRVVFTGEREKLRETVEMFRSWAQQVSERKDVPHGIRYAAAKLAREAP